MAVLMENHKNDNWGAFPDFYEFINYIFAIFLQMTIPIMAGFVKIFENHL